MPQQVVPASSHAPRRIAFVFTLIVLLGSGPSNNVDAAPLRAGVAKVDITNYDAGPVNDPLFVKALVITDNTTTVVLATLDVVAVGGIGYVKNDYLPTVRAALLKDLKIKPEHVLVNASHCHGIPCADVAERTLQAVKDAAKALAPVTVGVGVGHEDRIMENRRLKLKSGKEADVRHAYSLPPDDAVAEVGPIDPEIGLLRLDTENGRTLAVVYNFAVHPIMGVPNGGNTADLVAYSSKVLEDAFGNGALAFFIQGCGGDINPAWYKDTDHPRDAETLGNLLGLSALRAAKAIQPQPTDKFQVLNETITLPRADLAERIALQETEQLRVLRTLKGTSLNLKTFLPLIVKHKLSDDFPGYYSHGYLREKQIGKDDLVKTDAINKRNLEAYIQNIYAMEELTRIQTNLDLLKMHHAQNIAAGKRTIDVEIGGLRLGDFRLITFPGELTVRIGLNIKEKSPHDSTFVAGYTNGYIYYCPTEEQLLNVGNAQEDSDCILGPGWQEIFEDKAAQMLKGL